jgi:DNA-binding transcriptional LysR family regulator
LSGDVIPKATPQAHRRDTYQKVSVELIVTNQRLDLLAEGIDLAIAIPGRIA